MLVRASDINVKLDTDQDLWEYEEAMGGLPHDRVLAVSRKLVIPDPFASSMFLYTTMGFQLARRKGLTLKGRALDEAMLSLVKVQQATKNVIAAAWQNKPLPIGADITHCVEALDFLQKVFASHPEEFFTVRSEAERAYPGSVELSHPTKPMGAYLLKDPGSRALIEARLPVNAGTSGTSSNVANAIYNITGIVLPDSELPHLVSAMHAYLAGPELIKILSPKIESGVLQLTGPDVFSTLERTGYGQTHTRGEVWNALMLTRQTQKIGQRLTKEDEKRAIDEALARALADISH